MAINRLINYYFYHFCVYSRIGNLIFRGILVSFRILKKKIPLRGIGVYVHINMAPYWTIYHYMYCLLILGKNSCCLTYIPYFTLQMYPHIKWIPISLPGSHVFTICCLLPVLSSKPQQTTLCALPASRLSTDHTMCTPSQPSHHGLGLSPNSLISRQ